MDLWFISFICLISPWWGAIINISGCWEPEIIWRPCKSAAPATRKEMLIGKWMVHWSNLKFRHFNNSPPQSECRFAGLTITNFLWVADEDITNFLSLPICKLPKGCRWRHYSIFPTEPTLRRKFWKIISANLFRSTPFWSCKLDWRHGAVNILRNSLMIVPLFLLLRNGMINISKHFWSFQPNFSFIFSKVRTQPDEFRLCQWWSWTLSLMKVISGTQPG